MTIDAFSPVLSELPYGRINGKVTITGVTADADGWFYKPGAAVKIADDHTFAACASGDTPLGLVETGLHTHDCAGALSDMDRVGVILLKGRRVDVVPAAAALDAGDEIVINHLGQAAAPGSGATPMGIVWKGGAINADVEVIIY